MLQSLSHTLITKGEWGGGWTNLLGLLMVSSCNIFLELCSKRNGLDYFHFFFIYCTSVCSTVMKPSKTPTSFSPMPVETMRTGLRWVTGEQFLGSVIGTCLWMHGSHSWICGVCSPCVLPSWSWKLFWVGTTSPCVCLESTQHTMGWWKRQDSSGLWLCLEWSNRRFPVSSIPGLCLSVFISLPHQVLWFLWARQTPDKAVKLKPLCKSQMQNVTGLKQQNPFPWPASWNMRKQCQGFMDGFLWVSTSLPWCGQSL